VNVLVVMVDQLMPFLTGAYGHPVVRTPSPDRLAREGVRFDAAYTPYPLCSPARASFMTGRYASRLGCYDNAAPLRTDEPTIAHHLTLAGYDTVLSGKMHFVGPDQLHGFARRLTTDVYPASMDWVPSQDDEGRFVRGGHATMYLPPNVGVVPWTKFLSYDEETHFRALEYLRDRSWQGAERPFFLVASYHHPHDPFRVTQELWDLYEDEEIEIPSWPADVECSAMDVWANEAHGCADADLTDPDGLRALRRSYYALVTEYHVEKVRAPCFMARKGPFKYVLVHGHGEQLFDLEADPMEWTNLAGGDAHREVRDELRALILAEFDADAIAVDGAASVARRELVRDATAATGVRWDHQPFFDATRRYVR
jgi:choline-sulfatase